MNRRLRAGSDTNVLGVLLIRTAQHQKVCYNFLVTTAGSNWLFTWFAEREVSSTSQLSQLLKNSGHRTSLLEAMDQAASRPLPKPMMTSSHALAAGQSLDLSGRGASCWSSACLIRAADTLFARSWHLFDKIVVVGPSSHYMRAITSGEIRLGELEPDEAIDMMIESYFKLYVHLRNSDALEYLIFSEKSENADAVLVSSEERQRITSVRNKWVEYIASDASLELLPAYHIADESFYYWSNVTISHPEIFFNFGTRAVLPSERHDPAGIVRRLLLEQFPHLADSLVRDMQYARLHGASLGSTSLISDELAPSRILRPEPSRLDVAFDIPMPFIRDLTTSQLIRLRKRQAPSYEVFRAALKEAIIERVKAVEDGQTDNDVASQIANDIIGPALADIENRLQAARTQLARGTTVGLVAGTGVVTVGSISSYPVAGLILGTVLGLADLRNYLSNRREIETSEMYYLWRVSQRALHASPS